MIASPALDLLVKLAPMLISMGVIFFIMFLLRTKATPFESVEAFDAKVGHGTPVVLKFFSNG